MKEIFTLLFSFSVMIKYKPLLCCIVVTQIYLMIYKIVNIFSRTLMVFNIKTDDDNHAFTPYTMIKTFTKSLKKIEDILIQHQKHDNIVITHHAPVMQSFPEHYMNDFIRASYASDLKEFILKHSPKLWVHGHIHYSSDYYISATRVICNPRSYPDQINPEFNDNLIVEI